MDVHVHRPGGKVSVFPDANFSIGMTTLIETATTSPNTPVAKITQYFPTGDLWVFRTVPGPEGQGTTRVNIAFFPAGKFDFALWKEPPKTKGRRGGIVK